MLIRTAAAVARRQAAADDDPGVFYTAMSLLAAGVIVVGFGHDADARLFHRASPCPPIVYLHAGACSGFVVLFVAQCALVRAGNLALHRWLGLLGAGLGASIPFLGVATAAAAVLYDAQPLALLAPQIQDMAAFSVTFGLAVRWRGRPQYHRRLMFLALCSLSSGAFGRLPNDLLPSTPLSFYTGVDLLILVGVVRDLLVLRRVHWVYAVALPAAILAQTVALRFLHLG